MYARQAQRSRFRMRPRSPPLTLSPFRMRLKKRPPGPAPISFVNFRRLLTYVAGIKTRRVVRSHEICRSCRALRFFFFFSLPPPESFLPALPSTLSAIPRPSPLRPSLGRRHPCLENGSTPDTSLCWFPVRCSRILTAHPLLAALLDRAYSIAFIGRRALVMRCCKYPRVCSFTARCLAGPRRVLMIRASGALIKPT